MLKNAFRVYIKASLVASAIAAAYLVGSFAMVMA